MPQWLDTDGYLTSAEIGELFSGHEVAAHGYAHNRVDNMTPEQFETDLINTQTYLKNLTGCDVVGYAYPFGGLNGTGTITRNDVDEILKANNIAYARITGNKMINNYNTPTDFLNWSYQLRVGPQSSASTTDGAFGKVQTFLNLPEGDSMQLLMLFAHGHEIAEYAQSDKESSGWELFEELLASMAGKDGVWYATCAELAQYVQSSNNLRIGAKSGTVKNSSDIPVWVTIDGVPTQILPNRIVEIK